MPRYRRGDGRVYRRGRRWYLDYYVNGERTREPTDAKTREEARILLRKRVVERDAGTIVVGAARVRFDDLAKGLLEDYRANRRRSLRNVEARVRLHLTPFFGGRRVQSITSGHVTAYVAQRQAEGAPNSTINRELACLKRMFTLGMDAEKITRRPKIRMLVEDNVRKGFFERHELDAVLAHLPEPLRPPITFAYLTGWRVPSEVLPLTWANVDLGDGTVRLDPGTTKTGKGRVIYLTEELLGILQQQDTLRHADSPLVFHRAGRPIRYPWSAWRRACEAAGLSGRIMHDLRRTAVRNMVRAGVPDQTAMKISGHRTRSVYDRYAIVSDGDLRDAARRLDVRFRPTMGTSLGTADLPGGDEATITH